MNELSNQSSPYLLQHANNPVHWKTFSSDILKQAQSENKLVIISIGYSTCHWCHVMEHESFESETVASIMNHNFINIKVDREERPDLDAVYMTAIQIMTGRGGWPLNVVCLPDGRPIWGGTYFKKNEWLDALNQLKDLQNNQPEKLVEYANKLSEGINFIQLKSTQKNAEATDFDLEKLIQKWQKSFDNEFGGMARAPKFMMPNNYLFLMRYAYQNNNKDILSFVELTLDKMAQGGIFDVLHGGFSRYSVDMKWHVPHFEKMLYDNGQLLTLYAEAYKLFQKDLYKEVIQKTIQFTSDVFLDNQGAYFSALDADSLDQNNNLIEGAYYVWTSEELRAILKDDFEHFSKIYNINDFGYWEEDYFVLIQNQDINQQSIMLDMTVDELKSKKIEWENLLYNHRMSRSVPRLDDKIITSWNSLMIEGLVKSYQATGNETYLQKAINAAEFIITQMISENGFLKRNFKNNSATINAFLDDYALLIRSLIVLFTATLNEKWIWQAKQLLDVSLDLFYDQEAMFFSYKSRLDETLIAPFYEVEDNVIPSSNAIMAQNLFEMGIIFENQFYTTISEKMLTIVLTNIDYPSAYSQWLNLYLHHQSEFSQITIAGNHSLKAISDFNQQYLPNTLAIGINQESEIPYVKNKFEEGLIQYFVCKNKSCFAPVNEISEALSIIQNQKN